MKTKIATLVLALCTSFFSLQAQRSVTTTRATSYDISDNLDLDAVASIFGDSENLEDFERRLNDPDARISNLDLNEDGYIDYLRVLETTSDRNSLVVIQAVLDRDVYQDVATIEIERVSNGNPRIQIVGDSYIYGSNYIVEPIFVRTPLIFSFFWGPRYVSYYSPYYWGYYPSYYRYYRPYSPFRYQRHVHVHINQYNTYHRTTTRNIHFSGDNYNRIRRSDYASRYPNRAFESRNQGVKNRYELNERRPNNQVSRRGSNDIQRSNNRQYQNNSRINSGSNERQRNTIENRRPGTNVQSGTNQRRGTEVQRSNDRQYQNNSQINSGGSERPRVINENRRPGSVEKSGTIQNRTRENSVVRSAPDRSTSSRSEEKKAVYRNDQSSRPSSSRMQSAPQTSNRQENRVEPDRRSSAPREKSGSVSGHSRSNSEVKQSSRSVQRTESPQRQEKKENESNNRRR